MSKPNRIRLGLVGLYFTICYGILFWYTYGSPFCSRPGSSGHAVSTAWLALACTALNVVVVVCGTWFASAKKGRWRRAFAPLLSATITGAAFGSMPFWMYEGFGSFLWPDVSCFFTEGYAMAFPLVIAPPLAIASLLHCWLLIRFAPHPQIARSNGSANGWWPSAHD